MKPLLLFSLLLFSHILFGQVSNLAGTFYSIDQDRISLNMGQGGIMFENSKNYHLYFEKQVEINDTLKLYLVPQAVIKDKEYIFKVKSATNDSFILKPISKSSKSILEGRQEVIFYRSEHFIDKTLSFEKLIFYQGYNQNHSNGKSIQIDSAKNLLIHLKRPFDSLKIRNYIGKLTDQGYEILIDILRKARLKTLFWPKTKAEFPEQDSIKIILHFNRQKKELKTGENFPYISMELFLFLMGIEKYALVQQIDTDIKFDE